MGWKADGDYWTYTETRDEVVVTIRDTCPFLPLDDANAALRALEKMREDEWIVAWLS